MVSYAAGAIAPSDADPLRHVAVRHRILMTKGATTPPIHLIADNVTVEYLPEHNAGEDAESIFSSLRQLRSDLETAVVLRLIEDDAGLIVVDGRLPPVTHHRTLGFIKTPHQIPLSHRDQIETLSQLRRGERTPVFRRPRSAASSAPTMPSPSTSGSGCRRTATCSSTTSSRSRSRCLTSAKCISMASSTRCGRATRARASTPMPTRHRRAYCRCASPTPRTSP